MKWCAKLKDKSISSADALRSWFLYHRLRDPRKKQQIQATKIAVVLHLYYPEMWEVFEESLRQLEGVDYDLILTIPRGKVAPLEKIEAFHPSVSVFMVPNKGRDILPFIKVMKVLRRRGYEYVLKLHTKKSPQRSEGDKWLMELLGSLIPHDKESFAQLIAILDDTNTGIIGPEGNLLPLSLYYEDNRWGIIDALNIMYGAETAQEVDTNRDKFAFYAGTMFWARVEAIKPIFDANFSVRKFAKERGQLDGTFAHALERMFTVVPELLGKKIYDINNHGLAQREYSIEYSRDAWDKKAANKI